MLLDTTKSLIHSTLLTPTAAKAAANSAALDQAADDAFGAEVSAAMVEWIAKRMGDYHKNFHDTQLMQVTIASFLHCGHPQLLSRACEINQMHMLSKHSMAWQFDNAVSNLLLEWA